MWQTLDWMQDSGSTITKNEVLSYAVCYYKYVVYGPPNLRNDPPP